MEWDSKSKKIAHKEPRNKLFPQKVTSKEDIGSESEDSTYYDAAEDIDNMLIHFYNDFSSKNCTGKLSQWEPTFCSI